MISNKKSLMFHPLEPAGSAQKRRSRIRFQPDHNTLAYAKPFEQGNYDFDSYVGLVIDESHAGCRIAFLDQVPFSLGDQLYLSVGLLPTVVAQVKWRKKAGQSLTEIGFEYSQE